MSDYHESFIVLTGPRVIEQEKFIEAFAREDDEGETVYPALETVCFPEDYLNFASTHGVCDLKLGPLEITLTSSSMVSTFYDDLGHNYPSAFLLALTSRGEYYAYTRGTSGVGVYRLSNGYEEPEGELLSRTFTNLFVHGEGIDKLL